MTDEERLADLLLAWEERFERGVDLPAEELCRDCPELAPPLAARIQALKKVAWVNSPFRDDPERPPGNQSPSFASGLITLAGRYRLDSVIAEGGFGQVWRGLDVELQRPVAIKVAKKSRPSRPEAEAAFLTEARKVARLKHPGIVPVYDVGQHEGAYFIVSDLIDGPDLGERLRSHPPSVRESVRIVAEVARHLHHAHQQGFIHRDIKPANILMDSHARVFVTDFGIALTQEELRQTGDDGCGTLAYMSPEQLHGDASRIDARTDVYSLGVVLYQLLTRRLPFQSDTPEGWRKQILRQEPPPPRSLERAVPRDVERICLKCLAKSPTNRYPSAEALADDLVHRLTLRKTNWLLVSAGLVCCFLLAWFGIARPFAVPDDREASLRLAVSPPADRLGQERPLFNGRDTNGWEFTSQGYEKGGVKKQAQLAEAIRIVDGALVCREEPKYWLFTRAMYSDFVLKLDYRFPDKPRANTGSAVLLRMVQPGPRQEAHTRVKLGGWATGYIRPPFQFLPQSPEGYEPLPGLRGVERPTGEWNELTIVCAGRAIAVRVNGVLVNQDYLSMARQDYLSMARKGAIGLAPQGCAVEFRNIRLSPIKGREGQDTVGAGE